MGDDMTSIPGVTLNFGYRLLDPTIPEPWGQTDIA